MEKLYIALVTSLRSDSGGGSLVALTGHSGSDIRIARSIPKGRAAKYPFLAVGHVVTVPAFLNSITHRKVSTFELVSMVKAELLCIQIADRLDVLFHKAGAAEHAQQQETDILQPYL